MTTTFNRWAIAIAGVLMQIALGAVYAWSVFRIPLTTMYGWTISEVTFAFELAIFVLGLASFVGGLWMRKTGPRPIAVLAAVLYGGGTALAGLAHNLVMLYLAYGVIGGAGLGLAYIVPVWPENLDVVGSQNGADVGYQRFAVPTGGGNEIVTACYG